jgi:hypothetical protein
MHASDCMQRVLHVDLEEWPSQLVSGRSHCGEVDQISSCMLPLIRW